MGAMVFEIAGGPADSLTLGKGVGTKRLGKGRVKFFKAVLFMLLIS